MKDELKKIFIKIWPWLLGIVLFFLFGSFVYLHLEAMEIANQTLYMELDFAPMELLTEIAEGNDLPTEETELLVVYFKTKSIFDKYPTKRDDFDVSEERELLKMELELYIKENGLLQETTSAR